METQEHFFECPYCWKHISVVVDLSQPEQSYVEDCENCCHPIQISFQVEEKSLISFDAAKAG